MINNLLFSLKYSFIWPKSSCSPGGTIPTTLNRSHYKAADDLLKLALNYKRFCTAYIYAGKGYSELKVTGEKLEQTSPNATNDLLCYEAYNILAPYIDDSSQVDQNKELLQSYTNRLRNWIEANIKIKGENFKIEANSEMVKLAINSVEILFHELVELPDNWYCSKYSLLEFEQVHKIISALGFIQQCARLTAQNWGCINGGFAGGLYLIDKNTLGQQSEPHKLAIGKFGLKMFWLLWQHIVYAAKKFYDKLFLSHANCFLMCCVWSPSH